MSNTVAGRRQFDNSQECIAKKRQWRRHANENTLEQNASIESQFVCSMSKWYGSPFLTTLTIPRRTEKLLLSGAAWTEASAIHIYDEVLTFPIDDING